MTAIVFAKFCALIRFNIPDDQLLAIQEDVAKNSILVHDIKDSNEIETLKSNIRDKCQCEVEDLPHIQALVLHYPKSSHGPADSFLQINGIVIAVEDDIVLPPEIHSDDGISLKV